MRRIVSVVSGAVLLAAALFPSGALAAGVSGAIFTTDAACTGTNVNIFATKDDVYLDGGPHSGDAAGLPDGNYYVQVTDPSGATVLGKTATSSVTVSGGEFVQCYQLAAILSSFSSGFTAPGYDDTPNIGGEYKVWASQDPTFTNSTTKTDNFKVKASGAANPATLSVIKFYDANANGINDDGQLITGWKVRIHDDIDLIRYTPVSVVVDPDTYDVNEFAPTQTNWVSTTTNPVTITLAAGQSATVSFGNLCLGAGGGRTLGFWSNKNGKALFGSDDLALMVSLNLRNANGTNFNPAGYTAFRTWLLNATATNMAYMLSAQLAAMELNVLNGFVSGSSLIYAPGTNSANALGFASVSLVMAEANTLLGSANPLVIGSSSSLRPRAGALKNALDKANNNLTFVQSGPCTFTFP